MRPGELIYGMSFDEADLKKKNGELPSDYPVKVLKPFMENLAQEIGRALQFFFTSTPYNKIDHILLAGGSGTRLDSPIPKQFIRVAGKTIVEHSFDALHSYAPDARIVFTSERFNDPGYAQLQRETDRQRRRAQHGDLLVRPDPASRHRPSPSQPAWPGLTNG